MTFTAFNLTPLQYHLKQKILGTEHTVCIWKKETTYKTYQNKKNKINIYSNAVETSRLRTNFLAYGQKHSDAT